MQFEIPEAIDVSPALYTRMPTATIAAAMRPPSIAYSIRSWPSPRLAISASDEMTPTMSMCIRMEIFVTFGSPPEFQLCWLTRLRGDRGVTHDSCCLPAFNPLSGHRRHNCSEERASRLLESRP